MSSISQSFTVTESGEVWHDHVEVSEVVCDEFETMMIAAEAVNENYSLPIRFAISPIGALSALDESGMPPASVGLKRWFCHAASLVGHKCHNLRIGFEMQAVLLLGKSMMKGAKNV